MILHKWIPTRSYPRIIIIILVFLEKCEITLHITLVFFFLKKQKGGKGFDGQ